MICPVKGPDLNIITYFGPTCYTELFTIMSKTMVNLLPLIEHQGLSLYGTQLYQVHYTVIMLVIALAFGSCALMNSWIETFFGFCCKHAAKELTIIFLDGSAAVFAVCFTQCCEHSSFRGMIMNRHQYTPEA